MTPPAERSLHCTAPVPRQALRHYADLAGRAVNFDADRLDELVAQGGWHVDRLHTTLPDEPPGPPVEQASFFHARRVLERYEFADQRLIRAVFAVDEPLDGRDMLLVGRFYGLRFYMGVRVGGVVDGEATVDDRPAHRFAWHYRTLEQHLERGQMDYELLKWQDTGGVELRITAASQRAEIRNPIVRLGFGLFGRRTQLTFYERALQRTYDLVERRQRI